MEKQSRVSPMALANTFMSSSTASIALRLLSNTKNLQHPARDVDVALVKIFGAATILPVMFVIDRSGGLVQVDRTTLVSRVLI